MRVYKYVTMEAAKQILMSVTLRCAAPATFNDPFELRVFAKPGRINKEEFVVELIRQFHEMQASGERVALSEMHIKSPIKSLVALYQAGELEAKDDPAFASYLENWLREKTLTAGPSAWTQVVHRRIASTIHVCCFSANPCSLLMWAHYAGQHRGAILEFETDGTTSIFSSLREVRYVEDFPEGGDLRETAAMNLGRKMPPAIEQAILEQMLFMKSTEWSYEQEWRAVARASFTSPTQESFVPFPASALKAIHLGCRADKDAGWELTLLGKALNEELEVFSRTVDPTGFRLLSRLIVSSEDLPVQDSTS